MEFNIGNGASIVLPSLPITITLIVIIILLMRWSKELETRRFTIFFYFLISTYIAPIYSRITEKDVFEIWLPIGFIFILIYMYVNKKYHPSKIKASVLGFCLALYQLILQYYG
ncbi:hypothetical protein [Oceanobacillus massiliensis]|uniref:hypothetical protein n=1 Tax=Oceanobacillus massiliensis TaxID=1465765 RepID=UPI00301B5843